jgi:hypothetical protein
MDARTSMGGVAVKARRLHRPHRCEEANSGWVVRRVDRGRGVCGSVQLWCPSAAVSFGMKYVGRRRTRNPNCEFKSVSDSTIAESIIQASHCYSELSREWVKSNVLVQCALSAVHLLDWQGVVFDSECLKVHNVVR